jgi:hypothetical protein
MLLLNYHFYIRMLPKLACSQPQPISFIGWGFPLPISDYITTCGFSSIIFLQKNPITPCDKKVSGTSILSIFCTLIVVYWEYKYNFLSITLLSTKVGGPYG